MRTAAQRAFQQNCARAVQAAGLARHRSQTREDMNAGDTAMVRRNNKLTGRRGWTGLGVVVAVSPTRTSFWKSMRGCQLKCSSEQVRNATDAGLLGAEGTLMWKPRETDHVWGLSRTSVLKLVTSNGNHPQATEGDVLQRAAGTATPPERRENIIPTDVLDKWKLQDDGTI